MSNGKVSEVDPSRETIPLEVIQNNRERVTRSQIFSKKSLVKLLKLYLARVDALPLKKKNLRLQKRSSRLRKTFRSKFSLICKLSRRTLTKLRFIKSNPSQT